jgi:hypothetical protein
MNLKFKRLNKPRITKFNTSLVGMAVPERTKKNSAVVGLYIDNLVRQWAGADQGDTSGVDISAFGIEVKSQDIQAGSSWTIGTMTFDDIINTSYTDSSLYDKLQALFLVSYDNKLRSITDTNLYYFDNDEIQGILQEAYETARRQAMEYKLATLDKINQNVIMFGDEKVQFTGSQSFKGTSGYSFEYNNSGTSFKFRISNREMKKLTTMAVANNNSLISL